MQKLTFEEFLWEMRHVALPVVSLETVAQVRDRFIEVWKAKEV